MIYGSVNFGSEKFLVSHIIVEAKMKKRDANVIAQVKSSFVYLFIRKF